MWNNMSGAGSSTSSFGHGHHGSSPSGFCSATFDRNATLRRRKNINSDPLRVLVAGFDEVGKSALVVRCLTKKFIGEYHLLDDKSPDFKYKFYDSVDGEDILVEILDTSCKGLSERFTNSDNIRWADAFALVYAINDRESFEYLDILRNRISEARKGNNSFPVLLIANKSDLNHRRRISLEEGQLYATNNGWTFHETSTADEQDKARIIITELCREVWLGKRKSRNFLDRVLAGIVQSSKK